MRIIRARKKRKTPRDTRERRVLRLLVDIFPNEPYCAGGYWSWLPSIKGAPLQLDIFFPQLSIYGGRPLAIEVQGEQHRKRVKYWAPTEEDFERQLQNDELKRQHLKRRQIPLLEIWPEDALTKEAIIEKIEILLGMRPSG
jgi:hypothetical protein